MLVGQQRRYSPFLPVWRDRAQSQQSQPHLEAFLGLALKAQAQSRATIQAVVELKYPRKVAFVKLANTSHGPQQINNGPASAPDARTHAQETRIPQNKLLEDQSDGRTYLDTRSAITAGRSGPALETVEEIDRAKNRER